MFGHARRVRDRLWNPPNGRVSEERDIISSTEHRRRQAEQHRKVREAELQIQLEGQRERIAEIAAEAKRKAMERALADNLPPPRPTVRMILGEVCRRYGVSEIEIRSKRRQAEVVLPRHIIAYLCKEMTELSYPQIGDRLGNRDHTTILSAVRKMTNLVENSPHLAAEMEDITRDLQARLNA